MPSICRWSWGFSSLAHCIEDIIAVCLTFQYEADPNNLYWCLWKISISHQHQVPHVFIYLLFWKDGLQVPCVTCHHHVDMSSWRTTSNKQTQAFQEGLGPQGGSGWPQMSLLSRCALLHWKCWRLYHWWMVWSFNLLEILKTYCISCCQPAKLLFLCKYICTYT